MTVSLTARSLVLVFVPFDGSQEGFEAQFRETLALIETVGASTRVDQTKAESSPSKDLPLWTWFLPNPCP